MSLSDVILDQPFEGVGEWWLPEYPANKLHGRLSYSPDTGVKLEIGGKLSWIGIGQIASPQIIFGELEGRGPSTLFHSIGSFTGLQRIASQTFSASSVLIGMHAESFDQPIKGIKIRLTHLNDWASFGPFTPAYDRNKEGSRALIDYHVHYEPSLFYVDVPEINCQLSLTSACTETGFGHRVSLEHNHYLSLTALETRPLSEFVRLAHELELLVTLMVGFPSPITVFGVESVEPDAFNQSRREFLYGRSIRRTGRKLFPRVDMPANFEYVEDDFAGILNRWFTATQKFAPIISLVRSILFYPGPSYIENRFLTVSQALEGYCRIAANELHVSSAECRSIKKAMLKNVPASTPEGFRSRLPERLARINEFTFRERVVSLFHRHVWLRKIIAKDKDHTPTNDDVEAFAKQVVDARNSLTHVEAGRKLSGLVDFAIFSRVREILCMLLLHEAGAGAEENYQRVVDQWGSVMWWQDEIFVD